MADIRTIFLDLTEGADYVLENFLLGEDDGLTTAVVLSLFTDARASASDRLPGDSSDRRGWWGNEFAPVAGDIEGSLLWLLAPGKQLRSKLIEAQQYAQAALAWLIADGIAGRVVVVATNPRDGVLKVDIAIYKPTGELLSQYEILWSQHAA